MKKPNSPPFPLLAAVAGSFLLGSQALPAEEIQWYGWRGPNQNGTATETYEGWEFDEEPAWTYDLQGRGAPVVHNGQMVVMGYRGEREELVETLTALDAATGKETWELKFRDYISDTIYNRYSIGAPAIDPETGNIYAQTTNGRFVGVSRDGKILWEHSMMERFGRLTFPNGRTGAPIVEGNLVIMHCITSYWGKQGPARDRFYAFDKVSGDLVWVSEPGVGPKDSSFSTPIVETRNGKRVFYAGTGCGNMVCVNVLDGKPLWRFQMSYGGVNSSPVIYKDTIICPHGKENLDTTEEGRMVSIQIPDSFDGVEEKVLGKESEVWRNTEVNMFTSSPVLVGNRVYQTVKTGELDCIDADSGEILWSKKLGPDNLHASPLYADGKLFVPIMVEGLYVIEPSDDNPKILHHLKLDGNCVGSPIVWNGHLFMHTTKKLYCWKFKQTGINAPVWPKSEPLKGGEPVALRAVPLDVLMRPGDTQKIHVESLDANGVEVGVVAGADFKKFIPPTAKVKTEMDADFAGGALVAKADAKASAGAFMGSSGQLKGVMRGRVLPNLPYMEDFEGYDIDEDAADGTKFAYPPLPWIGARFKWNVVELDGNKVMEKTLENILFQRATTFIGHPDEKDYVMQVDLMTDGNRRIKSDLGLIHQRYAIVLKGNANLIEISSNHERLKESIKFPIKAKTWYTMKTQVSVDAEGTATVSAKVWPKGEAEPGAPTFEIKHLQGHTQGAPGLFGFSPQSQKTVYVDNISISPAKK
ncbi:MAG: outer membrane protein assembly factor BamB [Verrucomicrobiales bacterium]|jgi:outer membrane protein assembly factor BamB